MTDTQAGDVIGEKYRVEHLIGEGGMGSVWSAKHMQTDRAVAIKILRADAKRSDGATERFRREVKILGGIEHQNVVEVIDAGEHGDLEFLVMPLLKGKSLQRLFEDGSGIAASIVHYIRDAACGLVAVHSRGIVHRDLKPANIFVRHFGHLSGERDRGVVLDFGISLLLDSGVTQLTRRGSIVGTLCYMAPEQLKDERVDARTDIYALGVVLYEGLTGRRPFDGQSEPAVIAASLSGECPPPRALQPEIPPEVERIIVKAMSPDPSDRFRSAVELMNALEPFCEKGSYRSASEAGMATRESGQDEDGSPALATAAPGPPAARGLLYERVKRWVEGWNGVVVALRASVGAVVGLLAFLGFKGPDSWAAAPPAESTATEVDTPQEAKAATVSGNEGHAKTQSADAGCVEGTYTSKTEACAQGKGYVFQHLGPGGENCFEPVSKRAECSWSMEAGSESGDLGERCPACP